MHTLAKEAIFREEIKKSRFIVKAINVSTPAEALGFLEKAKEQATHNCWAYRIGQQYRFSDDGEPAGTAGKPILNAIERQDVDHVMVVVVRYFGGIKLGAGGLIRAYGGCATKCLQKAIIREIVASVDIKVKVGFDFIGSLYPLMDRFKVTKLNELYLEDGVELLLKINEPELEDFSSVLKEASAGKINLISEKKS